MSANNEYASAYCEDFGNSHVMPPEFSEIKDKIENFEVRDDDVYITSYPKSGVTWLKELVWLIGNDLDYERANIMGVQKVSVLEYVDTDKLQDNWSKYLTKDKSLRMCFKKFCNENGIEYINNWTQYLMTYKDTIQELTNTVHQRFIRTHLPWDLLPKQIKCGEKTPKIIHIMRNPKQVVPSYYYHSVHLFPSYKGNLEKFVDLYVDGKLLFGEYFNTVLSYWNHRNKPNVLILTYEEMHADLKVSIRKVCNFLGKTYTDDQVQKLAHHLSFDQLKENTAFNLQEFLFDQNAKFMREGSVDGYKRELSPEMIKKLDLWISKRAKGTGLPYEIQNAF